MANSFSPLDEALQNAINAARSHVSELIGKLPLYDSDLQAVADVLARSPRLRENLAELQRCYDHDCAAILGGNGTAHGEDNGDRRFSAPEWREIPWFNTIRRLYLRTSGYLEDMTDLLDLNPSTQSRLSFFCRQLTDAMSPANNPATNPQALKQAFESEGRSFVRGANLFASDAARGQISMTDGAAFEVGRNIAITPGDVIFENELIQLIQYRATTDRIHSRPLLIVPPFINKYYVLDLQEHNSFVRYCVEQGISTFIISWRNIPSELGHLTWEDYLDKGIFSAINAVRSISRNDSINTLGFCVGGTLLATALAVYAARKERWVNSLTLLASMLDFSDTGAVSVYVDEGYVQQTERRFANSGVLPGSQLSSTFASLRANELVWHFVENNYLLGKTPRAFDLLHWNTDSANLPGPLYAYYLRNMYLENRLRVPGALSMKGVPVDLGAIDIPAMMVATREDHIVPWQTAYRSAGLLGGKTRFVLGASGHVAGIVNPPAANRRRYWISEMSDLSPEPTLWDSSSQEVAGSWWNEWMAWLRPLAGKRVRARKTTGNKEYARLEASPGRYVREQPGLDVRLDMNAHIK